MKKPKVLHNFYKSNAWKLARELKIREARGLCERCGGVGEEVHHIKSLNIENVKDVSVSINPVNLELLCKNCHNVEHKRFNSKQIFDINGNIINK